MTVERRGRRSKVIIDGEYVASGEAPGTNSELNLDGFVFFGAEVTRLADGHEDVTLGFTGCLRDIKVRAHTARIRGHTARKNTTLTHVNLWFSLSKHLTSF